MSTVQWRERPAFCNVIQLGQEHPDCLTICGGVQQQIFNLIQGDTHMGQGQPARRLEPRTELSGIVAQRLKLYSSVPALQGTALHLTRQHQKPWSAVCGVLPARRSACIASKPVR